MAEYSEAWAAEKRRLCVDMTDADLERLWRCERRLAEVEAGLAEFSIYAKRVGKDAAAHEQLRLNNMLRVAEDDVWWASRSYSSERNARRYSC